MFAPLAWLLKERPLVLVGALTVAATTFAAFEQLGLLAEIFAASSFVIAFAWLAIGAGENAARARLVAVIGLPLAPIGLAIGFAFREHTLREALIMAVGASIYLTFLWFPAFLGFTVFIQLPVYFGTRARLENNLDRRDSWAAFSAAILGSVSAFAGVVHVAFDARPLVFVPRPRTR